MRCYIFLSLFYAGIVWGTPHSAPTLSFARYDVGSGLLQMNIVTPSVQGDVLLRSGDQMLPLSGGRLTGVFTLEVPVTCSRLAAGATLYWAIPAHPVVAAPIPPQACGREPSLPLTGYSSFSSVRIHNSQGVCWLDMGDSTLWRAALALGAINKATVYQNIYGLFLANKDAFASEDINRLIAKRLRCPSHQLIATIPAKDAKRLFQEMLQFRQEEAR